MELRRVRHPYERDIVEQNSDTTATPADGAAQTEPTAAAQAADASTSGAAPRRRSRRASAAVGEAVAPPEAAPATDASSPAPAADSAEPDEAPKRVSRARKKAAVSQDADEAGAGSGSTETGEGSGDEGAQPIRRTARSRATADADTADDAAGETTEAPAHSEEKAPRKRASRSKKAADSAEEAGEASRDSGENAEGEAAGGGKSARRSASRGRAKQDSAEKSGAGEQGEKTDGENGEKEADAKKGGSGRNGRNGRSDRGENAEEGGQRQGRTRQRERKRRGQSDDLEPEITEDDVLLPIAGILDVLDNYAFVRTSGYLPGTNDVYVSLGQVRKYGLRRGDSVVGAIRQPREGEGGGRQKYNAIVRVDTINSRPVEENQERADFTALTPIHPNERLRLETGAADLTQRIIDLFAPIGKGQRGMIAGPRESGKSTALRRIAAAVAQNQPDAHLMMVLVDERPEEVTELTRTVNGEVIASTFDGSAEDHATLTELAIERAKRLVELGHDVVVLIDSLTSLARSYNALSASRVPAGNLDAAAIYPVKRLLAAARNIENGGSLTIIATASAQPGSRVDDAVIGELDAATNMQLRLSGEAADRRVFPAVELRASSTRHEQLLTSESEAKVMNHLRRTLAGTEGEPGLEAVLQRLSETSSNVEFLALTQRAQVSA